VREWGGEERTFNRPGEIPMKQTTKGSMGQAKEKRFHRLNRQTPQ